MDTPPDSQRKAWARLSTLTSFVSRICFFKARCSDSDSVNGFIVIPPAFDFTRVRLGGVKKILSTYLVRPTLRVKLRLAATETHTDIPPPTARCQLQLLVERSAPRRVFPLPEPNHSREACNTTIETLPPGPLTPSTHTSRRESHDSIAEAHDRGSPTPGNV